MADETPAEPVPMSQRYSKPALELMGYISECEHRYAPSAIEGHTRWCTKLSDAVNVSVGIDPVVCAKCRLNNNGEVNSVFIRNTALNLMSAYLTHAILGFNRNEEEVLELLRRTYGLMCEYDGIEFGVEPDRVTRFKNTLLELVTNGRISEEAALAFCADKPGLI